MTTQVSSGPKPADRPATLPEVPAVLNSVCMATYNGERFVQRQLVSILSQLGPHDEVVVVDDHSRDGTLNAIEDLADSRIRVYQNPVNLGVASTFETAMKQSTGELLFLSDQDDIWLPHKVATVRKAFESAGTQLVMHDSCVVDAELNVITPSYFAWRKTQTGAIRNLLLNPYQGCCLAMRRTLLPLLLPLPKSRRVLHDWWIGVHAEFHGIRPVLIAEPLIKFVRHGKNTSSMLEQRKTYDKVMDRAAIAIELALRNLQGDAVAASRKIRRAS
jgi:glycosyltransferase involved in cell wall biosynthesis